MTAERPGAKRSDGVVVTGSGRASAPPDVIRLSLATEAVAADVQQALDAASASLTAMRSALLTGGVVERDLRTTSTTLWSDTGPEGRGPLRHTARLGLEATVRDVPSTGRVLAAALAAAGDAARLEGLTPAHSDDASLAEQARAAAFTDARRRAEQYAALAGRPLGAVRTVAEGAPPGIVRPLGLQTAAARMPADIPIEPGQLEVTASVTVHWAWA